MPCTQTFIDYIVEQMAGIPNLVAKPMFGEFGIWAKGKFFALVCNDQLFIKPTAKGRQYIGKVTEAPPYDGAKDYFLIEEKLDNSHWLSQLVRVTLEELPMPKPKKKKKSIN